MPQKTQNPLTLNTHCQRGPTKPLRVLQGRNLINPLTSTGHDNPAYHMPNYTGTWLFPPTKVRVPIQVGTVI